MPRTTGETKRRSAAPITRAFLFADLRGYTDFVERRGDAAAARLLRDYRTLVRREVARHDGAEVKTEGDSFYVVFPSASAALDCAVSILRRAAARNERDVTAPLRVGVGLHAGETVAYDEGFVGSAVNIASRLASKAQAGEIVISDTLRGLVRTSLRYEVADRGPLRLKGVGDRVRAWSVRWQPAASVREAAAAAEPAATPAAGPAPPPGPPAPATGQLVCPVVVGRQVERDRAASLLEEAAAGRGQTLLLSGEAGVGKSAFVRDLSARAAARGFRVLYGPTLESDGGLPYAPYLAAVRSGFRGLERERLGRVLSQAAPDLAALFPELGRPAGGHTESPSAEQRRLALAFHGLFATFARETPVLLVVEDLHWADEASLWLAGYLARELRDARVLQLCTYRSDELHRRHPLLRVLTTLRRERLVGEAALERLGPEQVRELIRATFAASDPGVTVSDEFRDAIYARSEGNPFFTEELLKSLVESGGVYHDATTGWERKPIDELRIPTSIREAVRERVERLSPDARATLAVVSVAGLQFTFSLVRIAADVSEDALETHLRELIEQQLLVEMPGDEERYAFRHALGREVVYDDLLVRERKRLHRAVAAALAREPATEPSLFAHHLLAAGEREAALPHMLEAAARAARAGAPREAVAHYERAIEIGVPELDLGLIVERLAETASAFDVTRSTQAAQEALALYRERADHRGASRMLRLASRNRWTQGDSAAAERLGREAVEILGDEESPELARALANLAGVMLLTDAHEAAVPLADRAIALGERLGDPWSLSNALITKGSALIWLSGPEEGLELALRGKDIAVANGLSEAAARGYNNAVNMMIGRPAAEQLRMIEEGLAYARRRGLEGAAVAWLLNSRAWGEVGSGDWEAGLATAALIDPESAVARSGVHLAALVSLARAGPETALPLFVEAAERHSHPGLAIHVNLNLALTLALANDEAAARARVAATLDRIAADPRGRNALASYAQSAFLSLAVLLDEPSWVELAAAERLWRLGETLADLHEAALATARSALAGETGAAARSLEGVLETVGILGLSGHNLVLVIACVLAARRRGLALGAEWGPVLDRTRAFAERVGARWWLAQLDAAPRER